MSECKPLAEGIFVNFRDLLYYNGGKLPFAVRPCRRMPNLNRAARV